MTSRQHHVFLSYARPDNKPLPNVGGEGWVTAFYHDLRRRHRLYSGRELQVFFDTDDIGIGDDWKGRLGDGLRSSKLFLAFLSANYIASPNCLWEWEQYLRHEHSLARGDDGVTPIFFVTPASLTTFEEREVGRWAREQADRLAESRPISAERLESWARDLARRNSTHACQLHPWFDQGPALLAELDAGERLADLKAAPRDPATNLATLAERLSALDRHIAARLDRAALADLASQRSNTNVVRSHEHFVGRHRELSQLHWNLVRERVGLIAAAHSPGGLGKTALARQYAHAYAEFFAAGGMWEISCEGHAHLGDALAKMDDISGLGLKLSEDTKARRSRCLG